MTEKTGADRVQRGRFNKGREGSLAKEGGQPSCHKLTVLPREATPFDGVANRK